MKGVLNVWHMVAYQRYYNSLVSVLSANARNGLNIESVSSALERKCATAISNAANTDASVLDFLQ